ncbi:unnamed protein product [Brassica rapa subsp. trilocularis]
MSSFLGPNEKNSKSLSLPRIKFINGEFDYNRYHLRWNSSVITHHYDEKVLGFIKGYFFHIELALMTALLFPIQPILHCKIREADHLFTELGTVDRLVHISSRRFHILTLFEI